VRRRRERGKSPLPNFDIFLHFLYTLRIIKTIDEAIGGLFGGIHYSSVSKVASRVREGMFKDKELSNLMDPLNSNFKA
jgi:hypothetical protein